MSKDVKKHEDLTKFWAGILIIVIVFILTCLAVVDLKGIIPEELISCGYDDWINQTKEIIKTKNCELIAFSDMTGKLWCLKEECKGDYCRTYRYDFD